MILNLLLGVWLVLSGLFLLYPKTFGTFLAWSWFDVIFERAPDLWWGFGFIVGAVLLYLFVALLTLVYGLTYIAGVF